MKKQRSLDYDGLDGILHQPLKTQSKPAWINALWVIPVIIALAVSVFLLQKISHPPLPTKTTLAQNFPSNTSEQTRNSAPIISKQALSTWHENSKIEETPALPETKIPSVLTPENVFLTKPPTTATEGNEDQTLAHSKAHAVAILPAKTPLISDDNQARPSANAIFTVYFKFDDSKPSLLSKAGTKKLINFAKRCPNKISLTGHTCNLGTDEANLQKGWIRANALKKLLIANGIPSQRVVTSSKGMRKPAESNDTLSGRALNRRVELFCLLL
jgi:OmpA-OmpF porin, OOP family